MKQAVLITAGFLTGWAAIYVVIASLASFAHDYGPLQAIVNGTSYLVSVGIAVILGAITVHLFVRSDEVN